MIKAFVIVHGDYDLDFFKDVEKAFESDEIEVVGDYGKEEMLDIEFKVVPDEIIRLVEKDGA